MRKFLTMLAIALMASVTMSAFTSCSSDDDGGGDVGYTAQDLVGTWEVAHVEGVADFDLDYDGEVDLVKQTFKYDFDESKGITEEQNDLYAYCFRMFYERHTYQLGVVNTFDIMYPICENSKVVAWDYLNDYDYTNYWELDGNKLTTTSYYGNELDVSSVEIIERFSANEMVVYFSAKNIIGGYDEDEPEKPNDYVWYRVTFKRIG